MTEPAPPRDQVSGLPDAVIAVAGDLDLQAVLRRIIEEAVRLTGAAYGALGVIDEDGTGLARFLVVGVDQEVIDAIGTPPRGRGILGQLIRTPRPLRLTDLSTAPDAYGLPPGHPPMHSFLGVPIRVRDEVFGNLYLTEKRGGVPFDERDESGVLALAAAAGVALQNARLYAEARRHEGELVAAGEVMTELLSGRDPEEVLALVARLAREVTGAGLAVVALPVDGQRLLIEVADGAGGDGLRGRLLDGSADLADALRGGEVAELPADHVLMRAWADATGEVASRGQGRYGDGAPGGGGAGGRGTGRRGAGAGERGPGRAVAGERRARGRRGLRRPSRSSGGHPGSARCSRARCAGGLRPAARRRGRRTHPGGLRGPRSGGPGVRGAPP